LLVALDDLGWTRRSIVRVQAGVDPPLALVQQVVRAVQLDLDGVEAIALGFAQPTAVAGGCVQLLLLGGQGVDAVEQVEICHEVSLAAAKQCHHDNALGDNGTNTMGSTAAEQIDAEREGWYELNALVRSLTMDECIEPGYNRDPDWAVRDLVGHLGTWLAEAEIQLERIHVGTYEGHDIDVDGLNLSFLEAMRDQAWTTAWVQANAGRTRMLQARAELRDGGDEVEWWVRKSGPEHYAEHLPRLREWVHDLVARRTRV
jgi:hypothetical protein